MVLPILSDLQNYAAADFVMTQLWLFNEAAVCSHCGREADYYYLVSGVPCHGYPCLLLDVFVFSHAYCTARPACYYAVRGPWWPVLYRWATQEWA